MLPGSACINYRNKVQYILCLKKKLKKEGGGGEGTIRTIHYVFAVQILYACGNAYSLD